MLEVKVFPFLPSVSIPKAISLSSKFSSGIDVKLPQYKLKSETASLLLIQFIVENISSST